MNLTSNTVAIYFVNHFRAGKQLVGVKLIAVYFFSLTARRSYYGWSVHSKNLPVKANTFERLFPSPIPELFRLAGFLDRFPVCWYASQEIKHNDPPKSKLEIENLIIGKVV